MAQSLLISPQGRLGVFDQADEPTSTDTSGLSKRAAEAFESGTAVGLFHLATTELTARLPAPAMFARELASAYLTRLCQAPGEQAGSVEPGAAPATGTAEATAIASVPPPSRCELESLALRAPPMRGLEYLNADVLEAWWRQLDAHVRQEIQACPGGVREYLRQKNPLWRTVGQVTFHLAENKRDEQHPFAFLATYASRLSTQGRVQHLPLSRALQDYAGAGNRAALLSLLTPIHRAAECVGWVKELVDSRGLYQPLAWTPREAFEFLRAVPALEQSGLIVRVPDWWKAQRPAKPQVSVKVGEGLLTRVGVDALLDFSVGVTLDGAALSEEEIAAMAGGSGLVRLRGQWVEVDGAKLTEALAHWKKVERSADGGVSFIEGMRLLAGAGIASDSVASFAEPLRQWTGIEAGEWLRTTLAELREPAAGSAGAAPQSLRAELRPYQVAGYRWLQFTTRLGLGACLADDMGLGKTIQVIALLLSERERSDKGKKSDAAAKACDASMPSLLVAPASLIANWKAEIERFAPSLRFRIAHPSDATFDLSSEKTLDQALRECDLAITTYGMLARLDPLRNRQWRLAILDEAQAIKNASSRQTRAVKELKAGARIALTGTPVENRLSDLWSLFDFLNPGLLGDAKSFGRYVKELAQRDGQPYAPLRSLVRPYILRRLKTDKRVIADLPEKTEVKTYCGLSKQQAALYEQSVRELAEILKTVDGIQRRGVVLAFLMRFKQICNHPAQARGDGDYGPAHSGKFLRLTELCEELAQRQERALVFTQFREIADPLAEHLRTIYGRDGLVLHGGTAVPRRRQMVESFQRDDGPPFFVLSLKAGGTGLNLTAASHVIHFDRWWNPAVENQATDRAFRIGQKRNVLVHKFICSGTVEEKIDAMIAEKTALSKEMLDDGGGGERLLTEMNDEDLLKLVSLDLNKAVEL